MQNSLFLQNTGWGKSPATILIIIYYYILLYIILYIKQLQYSLKIIVPLLPLSGNCVKNILIVQCLTKRQFIVYMRNFESPVRRQTDLVLEDNGRLVKLKMWLWCAIVLQSPEVQSPETSIRRRGSQLHISARNLRRILKTDLKMFPYKIQLVQKLLPRDPEQRVEYTNAIILVIIWYYLVKLKIFRQN